MNKEKILEYYENHKGEVIGAGSGLVFAVLVLIFGFWSMLFVAFCSVAGWYLGKKAYENNNFFKEIIAKIITFLKER
ncbi:MAG: DUF2273 domain-containing protein [Deltaproteobacteria bacterium]